MATITLKHQKNQSHEIRVEDLKIGKVNSKWTVKEEASTASFFMEEYKEAIEMVNAIIALCDSKKEDGKRNGSTKKESESINNRILFIGQRGTGKTSAMTSFSKGLDDAEIDNHKVLYFKRLPMIDPSNFDNNTNILLTVITMMFSEAKELMKENGNNDDIISTRESLLKQFDEVFKSLKAITGSDRPTFTLEGLNEKSRALQMRTGMHSLVKRYIEFYNKTRETNIRYLVLLIDDIDMTVSHVPEMLEQLRKYLDLDNLLILMSANLGQLYNEMREHYSKAFKETLNDRNQALSIDVEDLANKYLLKLFPTSRRIRVEHSVKQLLETRLEIKDVGPENTRGSFSNAKGSFSGSYRKENEKYSGNFEINDVSVNVNRTATPKSESIEGFLQNVVLSLIWQKTRLLFIPKDANTMLHPIIPTNLRELMQFLDMLTSLKEVKYKDGRGNPRLFGDIVAFNHCKENVEKFKKYILHNWIPNHLSVAEELVFEHIPTDITEINKHLINSINVIGNQHRRELMSREVGLDMIERNAEDVNIDRDIYTMVSLNDPKFVKANKISDIFNQPSNYSYGDLLLMIDKYETYFESEDNRKFTDAIKIYYSILLFETMFFGSKNVIYEKSKTERVDLDDLIIPIQKLIGGTVYYPNYFEIITDKHFNQKGPSFDAKRAFYHKLPVSDNVGEDYPFYAVLYYGDIRPDRYDTNHIYDTTFDNNAQIEGNNYVTFDILSILSNMLNPWHTYKRADGKLNDENDAWKERIERWSKSVSIKKPDKEGTYGGDNNENEKENTPNSILPFYSVDIMLQYLKQSQPSNKVSPELSTKDLDKIVTMRDKYSKALFGLQDKSDETSLWRFFVQIIEELEEKNKNNTNRNDELYFNDLIEVGEDSGQSIKKIVLQICQGGIDDDLKQIIKDNLNRIIKDDLKQIIEKEPIGKKPDIEVLLNNLFIISRIYICFKKHSMCPSLHGVRNVTDAFKNYVIAVLLKHYTGGKKNLNTLIKDLNKCKTVSETYRLVVDYLWVNSVNEILIRNKIQESIRKYESVSRYYVILWSETVRMLEVIAHPVEKTAIKIVSENEWMEFFGLKSRDSSPKKSLNEMKEKLGNSNAIVLYLNLFMEAKAVFIDKILND